MTISFSGYRKNARPSMDAQIIWIEKNPHFKQAGSAAGLRFSHYHGARTVAEYLEKGGTWADLTYDNNHNLLNIATSGPGAGKPRSTTGDTQ